MNNEVTFSNHTEEALETARNLMGCILRKFSEKSNLHAGTVEIVVTVASYGRRIQQVISPD